MRRLLFLLVLVLCLGMVSADDDQLITVDSLTEDMLAVHEYNAKSFIPYEDELASIQYEKNMIEVITNEIQAFILIQWNYIFQIIIMLIILLTVRLGRILLYNKIPELIISVARGRGNEV